MPAKVLFTLKNKRCIYNVNSGYIYERCKTLRKNAYLNLLKILPPKTEHFQMKNSDMFSYFCSKHRLWVLIFEIPGAEFSIHLTFQTTLWIMWIEAKLVFCRRLSNYANTSDFVMWIKNAFKQ